MAKAVSNDWNPEAYSRFRGFRLRPALDLLAQVGRLPEGSVIDLGCGDGAVGPALRARFGRELVGVDASDVMLQAAARLVEDGRAVYDALVQADIAEWFAPNPPAMIFSNAALHWLHGHAALMPRLVQMLAPGGVLAVQMPRQFAAPSHRLLWSVAAELFPDRFAAVPPDPTVGLPESYARLLHDSADVTVWETEYVQRLAPAETGHPVRHFTQSTAMRPILARLSEGEATRYIAAYDAQLLIPYPLEFDGTVLFPFRRLFFTVRRDS
jgi:trans-aconitate 2-methyltransferase